MSKNKKFIGSHLLSADRWPGPLSLLLPAAAAAAAVAAAVGGGRSGPGAAGTPSL
jgi:hypothetical protein